MASITAASISVQFFLLLLPCLLQFSSSISHKNPRLGALYKRGLSSENPKKGLPVSGDFEQYFYNQTIDHFNYGPDSYATFEQRYVVNSKHWDGPNSNSPILAYLGEESDIENDLGGIGFLTENAPYFKALQVYIEHRFYGKSIPLGSRNETMRGYFNSAQAIADYAQVLLHVKEHFSAQSSPIIVIGGSYGGMLASWFRLKYPHIALGALASSAPILYFDNITPQNGYYYVVTKDFKEASENCYKTIRKSWSEIDRIASTDKGLSLLSRIFKTCSPLNYAGELKDYLEWIYTMAAQYNNPPFYPVTIVCDAMDGAPQGTDDLRRIFAGVVAYIGQRECYDMAVYQNSDDETNWGWSWQTCSEMVMPMGRGENDTMFPPAPFNLTEFTMQCREAYGVTPRPHWITTYYGGHDIKHVLNRFGSNIIFSNGLTDPYSSGGVLEDLSESVIALTTDHGSHCLDILVATETDPDWLIMQRNMEVQIIQGWLNAYFLNSHPN